MTSTINPKGYIALLLGAGIATVTALAHLSCIVLGPTCYKAQLAPPAIVQSALEGTLMAPLGTVLVSSLFLICALFALSGARVIRRLPLLNFSLFSFPLVKWALITIASICLIRGLATLPLSYYEPRLNSTYGFISGGIWFLAGLLYGYGVYSLGAREV